MELVMPAGSTIGLDQASARYLRFARDGDVADFEALVREHVDRAYVQARRFLGSPSDAEDAVQEAILQLLRGARSYDGSVPFASRWARLVHIACLRVVRSGGRRRRHEMAARDLPQNSGQPHADDNVAAVVRAAVLDLSETDRAAIDLHYYSGLSQREAANALGLSENALSVRLHRARERLRTRLLRRGVSVGAAVIASALTEATSVSAPVVLATSARSLAEATSTLPITLVKIGFVQGSIVFVQCHPFITAAIAFILLATGVGVFAADEGNLPPKALPCWTGPALAVLENLPADAQLTVGMDIDSVRIFGANAKPTSLLSDPEIAPILGRITKELDSYALFVDYDLLRVWHYWPSAHAMGISGYRESSTSGAVALDAGEYNGMLSAFFRHNFHLDDDANFAPRQDFDVQLTQQILRAGSISVLARMEAQARTKKIARREWLASPIFFEADFSNTLRRLDAVDRDHSDPLQIAALLPEWRSDSPRILMSGGPEGGEWISRMWLEGIAHPPLRALRSDYAGLVTEDLLAGAAVAVDASWFVPFLESMAGVDLHTPLKLTSAELSSVFTGDAALVVRQSSPLPLFTLTIGVRDRERCRTILPALNRILGAEATSADRSTLVTDFGSVDIALRDDRLLLTSDPLGADAASQPVATNTNSLPCAKLMLNLPTIATTWLPLLYAAVPEKPRRLHGEISLLYSLPAYSNALQIDNNGTSNKKPSETIKHAIYGADRLLSRPLSEVLDTCIAWYSDGKVDANGRMTFAQKSLVVYRLPDGLHIARDQRDGLLEPISKSECAKQTEALTKICGPDPDDLPILPLTTYDFPRFDRGWLPSIDLVVKHLPRYVAEVRCEDGVVSAEEHGIPVGALYVAAIASICAVDNSFEQSSLYYFAEREGPALEKKYAARLAPLKRVAGLCGGRAFTQIPDRLSGFVSEGSMTLAEFASWFDGNAPTSDQLDHLGTWHKTQDNMCYMTVELEPGWWAHVGFGRVSISATDDVLRYGYNITAKTEYFNPTAMPPPAPPKSDF
jgi:RNA polymerase sigma factor (sigma-70 family)